MSAGAERITLTFHVPRFFILKRSHSKRMNSSVPGCFPLAAPSFVPVYVLFTCHPSAGRQQSDFVTLCCTHTQSYAIAAASATATLLSVLASSITATSRGCCRTAE